MFLRILLRWFACLVMLLLFYNRAFPQNSGFINYQAIAHDCKGERIVNQTISQRLTVYDTDGKIIYQEYQLVNTDSAGIFNSRLRMDDFIEGKYYSVLRKNDINYRRIEIELEGLNGFVKIEMDQFIKDYQSFYSNTFRDVSFQDEHTGDKIILGNLFLIVPGIKSRIKPVQSRLICGESPFQIFKSGIPVDSLIGKNWGGGYIFYMDSTDGTGLVCAPENYPFCKWGCIGVPIFEAHINNTVSGINSEESIWNQKNTTSLASHISYRHKSGDYTDWFLPTKEELNLMYKNLKLNGIGQFGTFYYWSSTENGEYTAWGQFFYNGSQYSMSKNFSFAVRLVREF